MTDSKDIYNLLLKQLKDKLGKEECKDSTLKIALDFIKTFELDEELKEDSPKDLNAFISKLPFRS